MTYMKRKKKKVKVRIRVTPEARAKLRKHKLVDDLLLLTAPYHNRAVSMRDTAIVVHAECLRALLLAELRE